MKANVRELYMGLDYFRHNLFRNDEILSNVEVEINTDCNRRCRICPRHDVPGEHGFMEDNLYDLLLDQLKDIDFDGQFSPVFYNEPLLDKRLPKLMEKAKNKLSDIEIIVYTNGSLITEDKIRELVDHGVDGIFISQYNDNLRYDDKSDLVDSLPKDLAKHIRYRILQNDDNLSTRSGLVEVEKPVIKSICYKPSTNAVINYKGDVVVCCNDFFSQYSFGNISEEHIHEIWNSDEFKKVRKELRRGIFNYDICRACHGE
ncbi:MAG: radical SAM/SPASM domain-containing protein [Candidatus Woesearchaeota archaeon]